MAKFDKNNIEESNIYKFFDAAEVTDKMLIDQAEVLADHGEHVYFYLASLSMQKIYADSTTTEAAKPAVSIEQRLDFMKEVSNLANTHQKGDTSIFDFVMSIINQIFDIVLGDDSATRNERQRNVKSGELGEPKSGEQRNLKSDELDKLTEKLGEKSKSIGVETEQGSTLFDQPDASTHESEQKALDIGSIRDFFKAHKVTETMLKGQVKLLLTHGTGDYFNLATQSLAEIYKQGEDSEAVDSDAKQRIDQRLELMKEVSNLATTAQGGTNLFEFVMSIIDRIFVFVVHGDDRSIQNKGRPGKADSENINIEQLSSKLADKAMKFESKQTAPPSSSTSMQGAQKTDLLNENVGDVELKDLSQTKPEQEPEPEPEPESDDTTPRRGGP